MLFEQKAQELDGRSTILKQLSLVFPAEYISHLQTEL